MQILLYTLPEVHTSTVEKKIKLRSETNLGEDLIKEFR